MIIKMPKPTKEEMIVSFLNQWDPLDYIEKGGFMFYNYEAEVIAQHVRKNSRSERIEAVVRKSLEEKAQIEGFKNDINSDDCKQVAFLIHAWMKSQ